MSHFLYIYHVDPKGQAKPIDEKDLPAYKKKPGYTWVHLDSESDEAQNWLNDDLGVDRVAERTLLSKDGRPRTIAHKNDILINLRGVNLNPGSRPEDMIGIRFFVQANRVISAEIKPLKASRDIVERMNNQIVSPTPGGFIASYALALADRMAPTIAALNEHVDELEEKVDNDIKDTNSENLSHLRREAIQLRRYLAPQRDALNTLSLQAVEWISDEDRLRIRDAADQATRVTEELDAIRERCAVVKDQLTDKRADQMNRNMMLLSIVAAIFLPLSLISGMMGINVGGMPWIESGHGFWYVTGIILVVGLLQLLIFRMMKWL